MRYDAVFFDMDGTVLDTLGDLTDSVNHCLALYGLPQISQREAASFLGNGAERLIDLAVGDRGDEELKKEILSVYKPYYDAHCTIKTGPYAGIPELMERLGRAGVKCSVVSNKPDAAVQILAKRHFDGLVLAAMGEHAPIRRKPYPDMVLAVQSQLHAEQLRCLYVGDTEVDILTAKNSGMDCAAVTWGFRSREELIRAGAVNMFDTPEELGSFILE